MVMNQRLLLSIFCGILQVMKKEMMLEPTESWVLRIGFRWGDLNLPTLTCCQGFKSPVTHSSASPYFKHISGDNKSSDNKFRDEEGDESLFSNQWSLMSSNPPLKSNSNLKMLTEVIRYGGIGSHSSVHSFVVEQNHSNWFTHLPSNTRIEYLSQPQVVRPQPTVAASKNVATTGSGTWKIFGVNLNNNPPKSDPVTAQSNGTYRLESCSQPEGISHQLSQVIEAGQSFELSKSNKSIESASTGSGQEKGHQPSSQEAKDILSKPLPSSTRNCTKVHKQGIALGRSVDLSRFNGYDELIAELDRMFE